MSSRILVVPAISFPSTVNVWPSKSSVEVLDYGLDFRNVVECAESIIAASVTSNDTSVVLAAPTCFGTTVSVRISGGTMNQTAGIRVLATGSTGAVYEFDIALPVAPQGLVQQLPPVALGATGPQGPASVATLAATGVVAGTYPLATVVVDADGRISSATAGSLPAVATATLAAVVVPAVRDITGLSPYTVQASDQGSLLTDFGTSGPYTVLFPAITGTTGRFAVDFMAGTAGMNLLPAVGASFYQSGAGLHAVGAGSAGTDQIAHLECLYGNLWIGSNVAYGTLAPASGSSGSGTTTTGSTTGTTPVTVTPSYVAASSTNGASAAVYRLEASVPSDLGVTYTPTVMASATTADYSNFTYVTPTPSTDITAWKAAAFVAFDEGFASFSRFDPSTGSGYWRIGSTQQINNETEFYPTQAEITAVGDDPFALAGNVLTFNLRALNPGYSGSVQAANQQWQSGRIDSSMQPGFYAESGQLYLEVTAKLPNDPAAWPAPLWAIASDGDYPIEVDVAEVFGDAGYYDATTHYQDATGSGNHSKVTRTFFAKGTTVDQSFHKFGSLIDYNAQTISSYFDDHLVGTVSVATGTDTIAPGFAKEIFLIADLATGGLVASPTSTTTLPLQMQLAQVRVYYGQPSTGSMSQGLVTQSATYSGTQPETTAYVAACTTPPSATYVAALNTMITTAKTLGFFDAAYRPDHLWLLAAETEQAALIDLMNPTAAPATVSGTLTFTANRGFVGATPGGSSGYIDTGISLAAVDPSNVMLQAFITDISTTFYSGALLTTSDAGNSTVRMVSRSDGNEITLNVGYTYGADDFPSSGNNPNLPVNPQSSKGFFGVSKIKATGANVVSNYIIGASDFCMANNYSGTQNALPTANLRLIGGDDGAAMVLASSKPWHMPRMQVWRDQVIKPFLAAIGYQS